MTPQNTGPAGSVENRQEAGRWKRCSEVMSWFVPLVLLTTMLGFTNLRAQFFAPPVEWMKHGEDWLKVQNYVGVLSYHPQSQEASPSWMLDVYGYHRWWSRVHLFADGRRFAHVSSNYMVHAVNDPAVTLYHCDGLNVLLPASLFVDRVKTTFEHERPTGSPDTEWMSEVSVTADDRLKVQSTWGDVTILDAHAMLAAIEQQLTTTSVEPTSSMPAGEHAGEAADVHAADAPDESEDVATVMASNGEDQAIAPGALVTYGNDINRYAGYPAIEDDVLVLTPNVLACSGAGFLPSVYSLPFELSFSYRMTKSHPNERQGGIAVLLGAEQSAYAGLDMPVGDGFGYKTGAGGIRVCLYESGNLVVRQGDEVLENNWNAFDVESEGKWVKAVITVTHERLRVKVGRRTYIKWRGNLALEPGHIGFSAATAAIAQQEHARFLGPADERVQRASHQIMDITIRQLQAPATDAGGF